MHADFADIPNKCQHDVLIANQGEWNAGMAHGKGTEWYPDGRIRHEGQWFEDEPVRDEYSA